MRRATKLLFLVTEDWYFCTHRLSLAVAARSAGYDVVVATRVNKHGEKIKQSGLRLIPLKHWKRSSANPIREFSALVELWRIYRREMPDLVHHVALKPVVYGTLVANLSKVRAVVNALAGLGFVFSSSERKARLLKPVVIALFRTLLARPRGRVIVQNNDDMELLLSNRVVGAEAIDLIRGAGVALDDYQTSQCQMDPPLVVLASRMLWDKGVGVFVKAAESLKSKGMQARFVLVGEPDVENPGSVSREQLNEWARSGVVEWWGYCDDIPAVLHQSQIVCLPTYYGEGIPKILIEAMASARPIVTTDMPGCRELVIDSRNGVLIPPKDPEALANALESLIVDRELCAAMGRVGRELAEQEFSSERVLTETLGVYDELAA